VQDTEHFSEGTVGVCFAVIAASYATATTAAGWLSDKTSPIAVIITGLLLCVPPFALLGPSPFLKPALASAGLLGGWLIWFSLVLLGSGCAFGLMPVLPAVLAVADRENIGHSGIEDLASGMIGGAYYLGGGAGPILGGAATALVGFEWASTSYGFGLLLLSTALIITLLITKRRRRLSDELQESLLQRA
jgi:MFS family permease